MNVQTINSQPFFGMSAFTVASLFCEMKSIVKNLKKPDISKSGFDINQESGFDIAVLTYLNQCQAAANQGLFSPEQEEKLGYFLLSNNSQTQITNKKGEDLRLAKISKPAKKRTVNRKHKFTDTHFSYGGEWYEINASKSGIYSEILIRIIDQLNAAISMFGKVLVYRFDLHTNQYTSDNKPMTDFRKRLNQKIKRQYGISDIGYVWVREIERSKHQHYHWVLFLDGRTVQYPEKIRQIIKELWEKPDMKYGGHMPTIQNPYYLVDAKDDSAKREAVYRISYLAKTRGKGYRDSQSKDYGSSRLKA